MEEGGRYVEKVGKKERDSEGRNSGRMKGSMRGREGE